MNSYPLPEGELVEVPTDDPNVIMVGQAMWPEHSPVLTHAYVFTRGDGDVYGALGLVKVDDEHPYRLGLSDGTSFVYHEAEPGWHCPFVHIQPDMRRSGNFKAAYRHLTGALGPIVQDHRLTADVRRKRKASS